MIFNIKPLYWLIRDCKLYIEKKPYSLLGAKSIFLFSFLDLFEFFWLHLNSCELLRVFLYCRTWIFACKEYCIWFGVSDKKQEWFVDIDWLGSTKWCTQSYQFNRRCSSTNCAFFGHFNCSSVFDFANFERFILNNPFEISFTKGLFNSQL